MDLNQYLNRDIHCACGQTHRFDLDRIDISNGAAQDLASYLKEKGMNRVTVLSDLNTYEAAGEELALVLRNAGLDVHEIILRERKLVPDEKTLGSILMQWDKGTEILIGTGSGTLNDTSKFISDLLGLDYIIYATAPSMDGFVSSGAPLVFNHVKTTFETHAPAAVFADLDVLANAPMEMITAGLGDILGKHTCLLDWKLSSLINGEYYCDWIVSLVRKAMDIVIEEGPKLKTRDRDAVSHLMEALLLTGIAMYFSGNSRPASGCEHHLSHYWEMQFEMAGKAPVLHGTKVGVGTVTAVNLYEKLRDEHPDFEKLRTAKPDRAKWESRVRSCFGDASEGILALEEKAGKNREDKRNRRLDWYEEHWDEMVGEIRSSLIPLDTLESLMISLGAPVNPREIGIDEKLVEDGVVLAKKVRDRFTLLQILWDLNLLEDYAEDTVSYFRSQPRYLEKTESEMRERLSNVDHFILDMDGTIYLENEVFPFTKSFLKDLKESGKHFSLFTNNSSVKKEDYLKKLSKMGIEIEPDDLLVSTEVALSYFKENYPEKTYYVVGTRKLVESFIDAGLAITDENPDIVVIGFDKEMDYGKIERACRFVRGGSLYFGINPDFNCPVSGGGYIPDCGSIAQMIKASTGRMPEFFGKPAKASFDYILKKYHLDPEKTAFVGDRIYTDIAIANDTPALSVLVLSGEAAEEDLEAYDFRPDLIVRDLEELRGLIK